MILQQVDILDIFEIFQSHPKADVPEPWPAPFLRPLRGQQEFQEKHDKCIE